MALPNATLFPVSNQSFTFGVEFIDVTTGKLVTSWTAAAATVYIDGANGVALSGAELPIEIQTSGIGYMTLTAAHMNGNLIQVKATVSNSNAGDFSANIKTYKGTEPTGGWEAQTPIRPEDILYNVAAVCRNTQTVSAGSTATYAVSKTDGTAMFSSIVTQTNTSGAVRNKLS